MRELFHLYFTTIGFAVVTASDGLEGLYQARAERPDVVITDVFMPGLNGFEFIRELRADPELKDLTIIALTAGTQENRDEALKAGADRATDKRRISNPLSKTSTSC